MRDYHAIFDDIYKEMKEVKTTEPVGRIVPVWLSLVSYTNSEAGSLLCSFVFIRVHQWLKVS
jgi:hypothetical protein